MTCAFFIFVWLQGFLHVGHAKAMNLDFGYARELGGQCLLRFDDTNPTAEKQEYIDSIIEVCRKMGGDGVTD